MKLQRPWMLLWATMLVTGLTGCADQPMPNVDGPEPLAEQANVPEGSAEAAEAIRALIPAAAGIQNTVMERIAASPTAPTPDSFESKTLTTMLFTYEADPSGLNDDQAEEFRFLVPRPKPTVLAAESGRTQQFGYYSMIQPDRITNLTCQVDGNRAEGVVSFTVPQLYEGKVHYVAERVEGQWEIKKFTLPAHEWKFVKTEDNTWKRSGLSEKLDDAAR